MPAKKYRKCFKPKFRDVKDTKVVDLSSLNKKYALLSTESGCIKENSIEAARKVVSRRTNREAIFADRLKTGKMPFTKKSLGVRMGSGKGAVDHYATPVNKGAVVFEVSGFDNDSIVDSCQRAQKKLPVHCVVIKKKFIF